MALVVSMSIEGGGVKVVEATTRGTRTVIRNTLAFPLDELDDYLARQRVSEFLVSSDFRSTYQETILLPPVPKSLIKPMLLAEMRKRNPSVEGDFAIVFFKTGDKVIEGRRSLEFFVIAVAEDEIDDLAALFLARGKRIKALYPSMLAVLKMLPQKDVPYICHFETGNKKNLFLIKGGKVLFTRSTASIGQGLVDYDIQNINMTINYCRQALRVEPVEVLCVGQETANATTTKTIVPTTFLTSPGNIIVDEATLNKFLIPVALLGRGESQSIATKSYRNFYYLSSLLIQGTRWFAVAGALLALFLGFNLARRSDLQQQLAAIRAGNAELASILADNRQVRQELSANRPLVDFMNKMVATPALVPLLSKLRNLPVNGITINRFTSSRSGDAIQFSFTGTIAVDGYLAAQKRYEALLRDLASLGLTNCNGNLVLKDRTFTIQGSVAGGGS